MVVAVVVAEVVMAKVTIPIKVITHMEVVNSQLEEVVVTLLMDLVAAAVVAVMVVLHMAQVVVTDLDQVMGHQ